MKDKKQSLEFLVKIQRGETYLVNLALLLNASSSAGVTDLLLSQQAATSKPSYSTAFCFIEPQFAQIIFTELRLSALTL